MKLKKSIFIVSDATGLTAERVVRVALFQFKPADAEIERVSRVRNRSKVVEAVQLASKARGIIVHTLVSQELRNILISKSAEYRVPTVDLIGPIMTVLNDFLETPPVVSPGLQHKLSESYFRGIESIEYTINHDDGQDPEGLYQADIVLVGVSRTSKTPLSMFLTNQYSLRVANIPIVLGTDLPQQLLKLDRDKIIGLTISPKRLMEIRRARIQRIIGNVSSRYADYNQILKELEYSQQIFASKGWMVVDVTKKSIEETASEIMSLKRLGGTFL